MTSEQHQFTAQGRTFPVILVRKKVKNINLHVRSDGRLYLSAPARVPWAYIEDFLGKPWGRNSFLPVCPVCSPYSPASPCPTRF